MALRFEDMAGKKEWLAGGCEKSVRFGTGSKGTQNNATAVR